jgi:hypothetical protein
LLDPTARTVTSFAGTGKPGQTDGAAASFYEPGGLTLAGDKLYVADTNNHANRVVDLKTKETKTLTIKGLQPPQLSETTTAETSVNQEEIKLPPLKVRSGAISVVINVELPTGYHLNPAAPQRYSVDVEKGNESAKSGDAGKGNGRGLTLPIRTSLDVPNGARQLRASFTFVYCREDNTGVCRIKTLKWLAPIEVVADASAPAEINLTAKVPAE